MMQQERDSFVFISPSETAKARVKQACEFLLLEPIVGSNLKEFLERDTVRPRTLLLDLSLSEEESALLPKLKQMFPKTFIMGTVVGSPQNQPKGFSSFFVSAEMMTSFAVEFFLFQRCYCEFYEISPTDLFPDTLVYFNAFHFLPLNLKYLPLVHENFVLSERKRKRIEMLKALYIQRGDASAYVQYIEKYFDQFKVGLRKRTRSRAYQLLTDWRDHLMSALFESKEIRSCQAAKPDMSLWLNEILNYLTNSEDPWNLIHEMSKMSCFHFDPSLLEVIVASFLSRSLGDDEAEKITDLRLLLTIGRFSMDSLLHKKWLLGQEFSEEEKKKWAEYPLQISKFKLASDFPQETQEDLALYHKQFWLKTDSNVNLGRLVYCYIGEVIAMVMQKSPSENYKKDDLLESVLVKCKSDAILPEAWLEELRQFLKK